MAASTTSRPQARGLSLRIIVAVAVTVISWGSAFAGIRAGLQGYSPAHLALLRYIIGSLALLAYAAAARLPLPQRRDLPGLALLGLVGIAFYNVALSYGEVGVPAGTASLLIASTPVWMALLATVVYRERLRLWGWLGIGLSFGGVATIALGTGGGLRLEPRALVVLVCALASSLYSLGQKPYLARYSALACTAYAIWGGTAFLLPFAGGLLAEMRAAPPAATAAVAYLGIAPGALGYLTWSYILARVPAARAGSFLYLVPVFAMLTAWLWLGEVPAALALVGGALVLAGVIVVNQWGKKVAAPLAGGPPQGS